MIKFSIITVVRNDLNGIKETYKSITNQSNNNYEWIVVDGNSTDGTKDFLINLNCNFLIFISEPDKGIYDAMNKGIVLSKNNYIIFLNAGDIFFDLNTLYIVANKLDLNNVDVLFGGANIYFNKNVSFYKKPQKIENVIHYSLPGHHQATYYSRNILNNINYDLKYPYSGDYLLIVKMFKYGISTVLLDYPLTNFYVGHHSFKGIFKILKSSTLIQIKYLNTNFFMIIESFFRRLLSTIIVILIYKFPYLIKKNKYKI